MIPPGLVLIPLQQELVRREVIQTAVGTIMVVLMAPSLHHLLGFCQTTKDLPAQAFRPQLLVETFSEGDLPGTAERDVPCSYLLSEQEDVHSSGNKTPDRCPNGDTGVRREAKQSLDCFNQQQLLARNVLPEWPGLPC